MPRRPLAPSLLTTTTSPATAAPSVAPPPGTTASTLTPRPPQPRAPAPGRAPRFDGGRLYLALAALALAVGGLSLLAPSTPSYDPWSWSLWAREIIHGHLTITATGTSWKPLPMLFAIPFALVGSAGPDLWLAVARAGAVAAVLMAFRLAHRLTRDLASARIPAASADADGLARRIAVQAPAVLAGLLAMTALGFAAKGGYVTSNGLGYSEGLATALLLVAIDCHLDGRHRACFLVGFLVALDRPEIWLFWIPYGLWLARRDRGMRTVVAVAIALQPLAWFLPVYLGSGHLGASVARAQNPRANSLAYSGDPFLSELTRAAWPTMMMRAKLMGLIVVLGTPILLWRGHRSARPDASARRAARDAPAPSAPSARSLGVAALLGAGGIAWFVVIAVMTQLHFSGNDRYLVLGAALLDICAAVGFGCLAVELGRAAAALGVRGWSAALGTGLAALAFALLPGWIERQDFVALPKVHGALLYQARLRENLAGAIARVGGPQRALACGRVMTEGFQVPMVAYALDVATPRVLAPPPQGGPTGPAPNVVLQTRATRSSNVLPTIRSWPHVRYAKRGVAGPWHTYTHCATGS